MTQSQFNKQYKEYYPNWAVMTLTDRRVNYNNLMEVFANDKLITERQRNRWGHPSFLTSNKNKVNCNAY